MGDQTQAPAKEISDVTDRAGLRVIAVVRENKTWCVLAGPDHEDFHKVMADGLFLPKNVAAFLFPDIARKYSSYSYEDRVTV